MTKRVVTVTVNPTIDVSMTVERLVPGHKLLATGHRRDPGGGGVNVSRALRRLGVDSVAWMAVGGSSGRELVDLVRAEGVAAAPFEIEGATRESFAVGDRSSGDQFRVIVDGPTIADPERLFDAVAEATADADVVVLSGMLAAGLPDDFFSRVALTRRDAMVVVDTFGPALPPVVAAMATIVKPSRRELEALVGRSLDGIDAVERAARDVLAGGDVGVLLVSLGEDGALLVPRGGAACHRPAPRLTGPVSAVGAGDALVAGVVAAAVSGHDLTEALVWGVAAGSAAAATPGTALFEVAEFDRMREQEVAR